VGEAIKIANDTDLGLSGSVFSADPERAFDVASQIKAGHLSVNGFEIAPSVPFGGRRASGLGPEVWTGGARSLPGDQGGFHAWSRLNGGRSLELARESDRAQ